MLRTMSQKYDYVLVGGGLQSALLVLALRAQQPRRRVAVIEPRAHFGGNHTWCFHSGDVSDAARAWMAPLVAHRWRGYRVVFPDFERDVDRSYEAITSERLHAVLQNALADGGSTFLGRKATRVGAHAVELDDGMRLDASLVIDARGPSAESNGAVRRAGYQKFVGLEIETSAPHAVGLPLLMDATVEQRDGFRFMYCLPFAPTRVLVEDTTFSDGPQMDRAARRDAILAYAKHRGWDIARVVREEEGVLPMPWRDAFDVPRQAPLRAGYRGGFFHPATGYSLPVAVRLAELVASRAPEQLFGAKLTAFARAHRRQATFCQRLNSMLFQWFPPEQRWHVFRRFYGLPVETIERFYALRLRPLDQGRLLWGRPPRGMSVRYRLTQGAAR